MLERWNLHWFVCCLKLKKVFTTHLPVLCSIASFKNYFISNTENGKTFITICAANWKAAEWRFVWDSAVLGLRHRKRMGRNWLYRSQFRLHWAEKLSKFFRELQQYPSFFYVAVLEQPIEYRRPACCFSPFFRCFFFASGFIHLQKISPSHCAGR